MPTEKLLNDYVTRFEVNTKIDCRVSIVEPIRQKRESLPAITCLCLTIFNNLKSNSSRDRADWEGIGCRHNL